MHHKHCAVTNGVSVHLSFHMPWIHLRLPWPLLPIQTRSFSFYPQADMGSIGLQAHIAVKVLLLEPRQNFCLLWGLNHKHEWYAERSITKWLETCPLDGSHFIWDFIVAPTQKKSLWTRPNGILSFFLCKLIAPRSIYQTVTSNPCWLKPWRLPNLFNI